MSFTNSKKDTPKKTSENHLFKLTPIAAFVASVAFAISSSTFAADSRSAEQIKAEVARLKEQLEKEEQALAEKSGEKAPVATKTTQQEEHAQSNQPTQLGKVVVRARNRIERLQDVPLSVSVVTGKELETLQAQDLKSITQRTANISWNQGNQRTSSISIRGVGKIGQTEAQDPSVGIVVDGVNYAYNPLSSSFNFTDLDAVEVVRGPQGTLQGKNANLGLINITTKQPSFTPDANYAISYGQRDTFNARFAGGGPVVDDLLAWRGTVSVTKARGDIGNQYNADNTYQNIDRLTGRVQFLLTPVDHFTAKLALDATPNSGENTNGRTYYTPTPAKYSDGAATNVNSDAATRLARDWFTREKNYSYSSYLSPDINNNSQQPVVTGSRGAAATLKWDKDNYAVTSITAYKEYHFNAHNNDEGTPFDIQSSSGQFIEYRQASQELRFSSQIENLVDYQTGLFFMKTSTNIQRNIIYGSDAGAWYATPSQYNTLVTNAGANVSAGKLLLQDSLDRAWISQYRQYIDNKSEAIFGQANWHISDPLTLTTGLRLTWEQRANPGSSLILDNGFGAALNPVATPSGLSLGGFTSAATLPLLQSNNTVAQLNTADSVAKQYFNATITGTPGQAYAGLSSAQKGQVAAAQAIRKSQFGVLNAYTQSKDYDHLLPAFVISPSYKINPNLSTYASWQYGQKAGIAQLNNGVDAQAKAEISNSYEVGLKSILLNNTLVLNTDIFWNDIKNYQQAISVYDDYSSKNKAQLTYSSITGNVPWVQVKGLEFDGVYAGIPHTQVRFSGAYIDAVYKDFENSALPAETEPPASSNGFSKPYYADVSGKTLPGAAKYTANIGVDYRIPVSLGRALGTKQFHTSANWAFTSRYNSDTALSNYAYIPANSIYDFGIGLATVDNKFDVSLIVKNALNNQVPLAKTWNSYTPGVPRWWGIEFSGKL